MRKTIFRIGLVTVFISLAFILSAQVQVTGRVIANDVPDGLAGAEVRLIGQNNNYDTESGNNGSFTINAVQGSAAGVAYRLVVSHEGYQSYRRDILVRNQAVNLGVIRINEYAYPPRNVEAEISEDEDSVILEWDEPIEWTPGWIHWDSGQNANAIGTNSPYQFTVAVRFTPENLIEMGVVGLNITSIRFFPRELGSVYTAKVWVGGSIAPMNAGQEVFSLQLAEHDNFQWNEVVLPNPVPIEGNQEIWIGYHVNDLQGGFPAGVDGGPHVNNFGNLIHFAGSWNTLVSLNEALTYNWNIQGFAGVFRGDRSVVLNPDEPQSESLSPDTTHNPEISLFAAEPISNEFLKQGVTGTNDYRKNRRPGRNVFPDSNRELEGYRIFRYNSMLFDYPEFWEELGVSEDNSFIDTTWVDLEPAHYKYAVRAVYSDSVYSAFALSNELSSAPEFTGGEGTMLNPWVVETPHNLNSIRNYLGLEHSDKYFIQGANVDLGRFPWNMDAGWVPIGSSLQESFRGNYDGDGFTISNLTITRNTAQQGLFGVAFGAVIENVVLDSVYVQGGNNTAALVGTTESLTTLRNCVVSGFVSGFSNVGGLVGYNNNSTVTGCGAYTTITATSSNAGGLVGHNYRGGKVIESFADSDIRGASFVGGLVGYINGIRGEDCGTIIDKSYSAGTVTGTGNWIGGLTGRTFGSIVRDSYSAASVSAFNSFSGGLIGQHCCESTLINSYAVGYTSSTAGSVGGLMGQQQTSTTQDSYWNRESTSQNAAPQGTPKTTAEMVQRNTFENWNFNNIWRISEGLSYPYFAWQQTPGRHNIPAPLNLTAEAGNARVDLTWTAPPIGQVAGYKIFRDGVLLNPEELVEATEYADTTVRNYLTYVYRVSAVVGENTETGLSNPVSVTPFMFEEGTGTAEDPYLITEAGQLNIIRFHLESHFKLGNSVDLGVEPWNSGEGWVSIGTNAMPFRGSLDGDGYKISNLTIDRAAGDFQGLFGSIMNAQILNIGFDNIQIAARNYVGGIVGYLRSSTISESYVTGNVRGSIYVGGFVGYTTTVPNAISNSYNAADVHSISTSGYVGGFVGYLPTGILENSYSIGRVSFPGTTGYIGGLLGQTTAAVTVTNSFWNIETSGVTSSSGGGEGKTTAEMIQQATYNEWDFDDVWAIGFNDRQTYPYLRAYGDPVQHNYPGLIPPRGLFASAAVQQQVNLQWSDPSFGQPDSYNIYRNGVRVANIDFGQNEYEDGGLANLVPYIYTLTAVYGENESNHSNAASATPVPGGYAGGSGTEEDPYQVENTVQLNNVRYNRSSHFIQTANVDLAAIPNWTPIGSSSSLERFIGSYDGDEYEIIGMTINNPTASYMGLFGFVGFGTGATLKNITLRNVNVSGNTFVGGLVGRTSDNSHIENCWVIGTVVSTSASTSVYVGGLIGYNQSTTVRNSYSTGSVEALNNYVGGLIGFNTTGIIDNCFSKSNVEGGRYVGGFVGYHNGTITNSYARGGSAGTVSEIGGFAGQTANGHIRYSFSTGRVAAPQDAQNVGGFIGQHSSGTITNSYWDTQTSGQANSPQGEGRTTEQMTFEHAQNTYVGWDFEEIWRDDRTGQLNNRYPYHHWQPLDISPNPTFAVNPQPSNQATNIAFNIERVSWSYIEHMLFSNPVGFRVYFNSTGIFGAQDPYVWVPYQEGEENYSTSDVLPANIQYGRTYFWRVVPTTIDPNRDPDNKRKRRSEELSRDEQRYLERGDAQNCPIWRFTIEISPNPTTARNPQPANGAVNIPLNLPVVAWTYAPSPVFANPVGFRVYLNTTGEFGAQDEFVWVAFVAGMSNYSNGDVLPERLAFDTTYHWKVVPTTTYPNRAVNSRRRNNTPVFRDSSVLYTRGDAENVSVWTFTTVGSDPNPHPAHDPNPEHLATGVSLLLNGLEWEYEGIDGYAEPAGFRVYMNTTGGFPANAPFFWVPYLVGETSFVCSEATDGLLDANTTYFWRIVPTTHDPTRSNRSSRADFPERTASHIRGDAQNIVTWRFTTGTTGVEEIHELPLLTELQANYPNPFNPQTTIGFALAEAGEVTITIFNSRGQKLITLIDNENLPAGNHQVVWDGKDASGNEQSSGIFFYRMKNGSYTATNKMIMLK